VRLHPNILFIPFETGTGRGLYVEAKLVKWWGFQKTLEFRDSGLSSAKCRAFRLQALCIEGKLIRRFGAWSCNPGCGCGAKSLKNLGLRFLLPSYRTFLLV
jgi:hypothetical protein